MQSHRITVLAVAVALASGQLAAASNTTVKTQPVAWYPCSGYTFSDAGSSSGLNAECATYIAPLCYPGICKAPKSVNPTIEIFVKRFSAEAGDSEKASNVWLLQGGPGYSSTALESSVMTLYAQLEGKVNVYTMDHRGTGRSTRLNCTTPQATTGGTGIHASEVSACAHDLELKYGDMSSFSMTTAATDVASLISQYTNGKSTIVYGVSYGTALVERLMHLAPPTVTGYVLDGIATTSGAPGDKFPYISLWDTDFGEVANTFLGLCKHVQECNAHFNATSLPVTVQQLIKKFDKHPKSTCSSLIRSLKSKTPAPANEPPSFPLRRVLGMLVADSSLRTLIPPIVYRLNRCAAKDIDVLTQFMTSLSMAFEAENQDDTYTSMLLYYLIVFSEMWESPTPSNSEMKARFSNINVSDGGYYEVGSGGIYKLNTLYCAFSKEKSSTCDSLQVGSYNASGIIYGRDEYWNKSATIPSQASVLLLSGKLDPQTPNKYAEYLLNALDGDKKELISFDYATHGTIVSTPLVDGDVNAEMCGMKILASFVRTGGDLGKLDKSCVDEMPAFNLTVPVDYQYSYLGTDDAYDGVYGSASSSQYSGEIAGSPSSSSTIVQE